MNRNNCVIPFRFVELQQVVGPELARSDLAQIFQALLKDPEAEVRAAAAGKVTSFFSINMYLLMRYIVNAQICCCFSKISSNIFRSY